MKVFPTIGNRKGYSSAKHSIVFESVWGQLHPKQAIQTRGEFSKSWKENLIVASTKFNLNSSFSVLFIICYDQSD